MRYTRFFTAYFWVFTFALLAYLSSGVSVWAQDTSRLAAPSFTAQTLEARMEILEADESLSDEQKMQILASLKMAADRLAEATRQSERRMLFLTAVENTEALQAELDIELQAAQETLTAEPEPLEEMIGDAALFGLERDLRTKESDLAATETRLQRLQDSLDTLTARQASAPEELSEARAAMNDLQIRLNALGDGELEALSEARRTEIQARLWYRYNQIQALEQEITTLASRQDLATGRRAVADVQVQILRRDVTRLGTKTGERRVNEAREFRNSIAALIERSDVSHPVLEKFAVSNLELADQIVEIAAEGPQISQATASVRGRFVDVENDLNAATKLVEQGRLDREAGETLRRLGNQLEAPVAIRAAIKATQKRLSTTYRQRIIAQENLRDLPFGANNLDTLIQEAKLDPVSYTHLTLPTKA